MKKLDYCHAHRKRIRKTRTKKIYFDPSGPQAYDIKAPKHIQYTTILLSYEQFCERYSLEQCRLWHEHMFVGPGPVDMDKKKFYYKLYQNRILFNKSGHEVKAISLKEDKPLDKANRGRPKRMMPIVYTIINPKPDKHKYSPQALACLDILDKLGPGIVYENQLASYVRERNIIKTVQDPWKIFRNYQSELKLRGHIDYEIMKDAP